ncbi:MAG: NnrS family protein [Rhodocyclaceae bacterium]|jgi:uncharacterized protein involved in response to NO|nr:NnrS family protein [Rhodocyclaceae bacterium]
MKFIAHPFWLVGFRPFFSLACLAGLSLPMLWALIFSGVLASPGGPLPALQWHAHEMFFGFGWAVLGGFLLTATKNWVQVRGFHGLPLIGLVAAWILERIGMACGKEWPPLLFWLSNTLFLGAIVAMLLWTLLRYRKQDSYRDNYFFLVVLPAFLAAKLLLLGTDTFQIGVAMCIGLFRMAFLVMLERTLTQFMKGVFQVTLYRQPRLDGAIKLLAAALVLQGFMPPALAVPIQLLLALLLGARFVLWSPHLGLRRIELAVMYVGYAAIVAQLLLEAAAANGSPPWVGSMSVHVFTFGAMGLIIPAMLIRISKGHTGRKVAFDAGDKLALSMMLAAFAVRVVLPQLFPAAYLLWIGLAAACWCVCFAILGVRYIPHLLQPRVDGKEH